MILTRRRRFAWRAVGAFIKVLKNIPWFRRIGHPLSQEERAAATLCAKSLGFTAEPVELTSWSEAADIAHALYSQSSWSEEEENISNDIAQSVLKIFNLDQVQVMTTQVQAEATRLLLSELGVMHQCGALMMIRRLMLPLVRLLSAVAVLCTLCHLNMLEMTLKSTIWALNLNYLS